jgi:hypothetical protein
MRNYAQVGGMHVKPPKKLPQVRNVLLTFRHRSFTFKF